MAGKKYDIVVIGGGHNGLAAAITLAQAGQKVYLAEARAELGGLAQSYEFHPGFRTPGLWHHTSQVRPEIIRQLGLQQHGLTYETKVPEVTIVGPEGQAIIISPDSAKVQSSLSPYSNRDAAAFPAYQTFLASIRRFLHPLMSAQPLDLTDLGPKQLLPLARQAIALRRMGKKTMLEFLKVAPMSVRDYLDELFETDFLKAGLAMPALQASIYGPYASYSALNLFMHESTSSGQVLGGLPALVRAMIARAEELGVELATDAPVTQILLDEQQRVRGVEISQDREVLCHTVASAAHPKTTLLDLLHPSLIPYKLEHELLHYRSRGSTAKLHLALATPPTWSAGKVDTEYVRPATSLVSVEQAADAIKCGQFADHLMLDIYAPAPAAQLAPDGQAVLSLLVQYVPRQHRDGWSNLTREKLLESVLNTLEAYAPNVRSSVLAHELLTPQDIEEKYRLAGGHLFHGEHAIDQMTTRPVPDCSQYRTPIRGLYLCGAGSHPGGGITCAPGYLAAKRILQRGSK